MSTIINTLQEIIRQELRSVRVTELGVVEAVYPHSASSDDDNYGCDVRLKNSGLLLKRVPVATSHIGTVAIPNVGDLVILAFDKGDINQPIVIGRLYHNEARSPLNNSDEVIFRLPLAEADEKTLKAAIRNIASNDSPREILVEMPPKITLHITDGMVRAIAGKTEMRLNQPGGSGGTVTVMAGRTKITMNQDGDVTIDAAGAMTLKATRDLTLEGQNVKIKSQLNTDIEAGTQATLKANMGATVNGGLASTVQGATVSVKGITSFSP
jgi:phage baseplate assembly protein gpV